MEHLKNEVEFVLAAAVAPSTASTYKAGLDSYILFCRQIAQPPFPVTEDRLIYFVTSARHRLAFKTIKVYLAAVQYQSAVLGFPLTIASMVRIQYVLKGIRRLQGSEFTRLLRPQITIEHLKTLQRYFKTSVSPQVDGDMMSAAALLAFFGLLRASEYLADTPRSYDRLCNLQVQHICFAPDLKSLKVCIPQSKTDPFRMGQQVTIWSTGNELCPVKAILRYVRHHPTGTGPLFTFANGTFLTRQRWSELIQSVISDININTHSFRIGGASAAAAAGIPDSTIQILGRWSSEAFKLYLRIPDSTFQQTSLKMARVSKCSVAYSPIRD